MFINLLTLVLDLLTLAALAFGLFFLFVGALGVLRLPDVYARIHAASKCVTLGIIGVLLAAVLHLSVPRADAPEAAMGAATKALLVIAFQFVAAPIGSHMLAKAAHLDGAPMYRDTLSDELEEDRDH